MVLYSEVPPLDSSLNIKSAKVTSHAIFEPECGAPQRAPLLHQSQHPGANHTGQQKLRLRGILPAAAVLPALQNH